MLFDTIDTIDTMINIIYVVHQCLQRKLDWDGTQDSRRRASLRFVGNAVFHRQSPEEFEWRVERKLVGRGGGDEWEESPELQNLKAE